MDQRKYVIIHTYVPTIFRNAMHDQTPFSKSPDVSARNTFCSGSVAMSLTKWLYAAVLSLPVFLPCSSRTYGVWLALRSVRLASSVLHVSISFIFCMRRHTLASSSLSRRSLVSAERAYALRYILHVTSICITTCRRAAGFHTAGCLAYNLC